jgi:hypothetical protein
VINPNRVFGLAIPTFLTFLLACTVAHANGSCDPGTTNKLHEFQRLADSIRVDKPGLARVYALDGTEFTAGQALWIKGQLREVEAACARSDRTDAAQQLDAVGELVRARSHQNL